VALLSKGDLSQNVMIQPGDTIYVSSGTGLRYHVLGQVGSPGPYEWIQDITVLEAIKLAGGVNPRGAPNRIKVRKIYGNGQKQEIKVNVVDIMKGKKKDDVVIKPGDTIIVPESWI
jgi:polysaccharide export outer membrane protein